MPNGANFVNLCKTKKLETPENNCKVIRMITNKDKEYWLKQLEEFEADTGEQGVDMVIVVEPFVARPCVAFSYVFAVAGSQVHFVRLFCRMQ